MDFETETFPSYPQQEALSFNGVKYQVEEHLGSGLTSDVHQAIASVIDIEDRAAHHQKVAVKSVKGEHWEDFQSEAGCLAVLSHPNIIKMVGVKFPTQNDARQLIALEYCKYELFDVITEISGFTEDIGRYFFSQQIIPAVSYMHSQGICHRDLKLDNIFIGQDLGLRIADFSFAARLFDSKAGQPALFDKQCGTVLYMAPEIQRGKKYHGAPADVWSLGVVLFMMVMGQNPFPSLSFYRMLWKKPKQFWSHFQKRPSGQFRDLVQRMLDYNPETRITDDGIQKHPWCQGRILSDQFIRGCFNQE